MAENPNSTPAPRGASIPFVRQVVVEITDPAIGPCAHFLRLWDACILEDEDLAGHEAWKAELDRAEEALLPIIPTTIGGVLSLLGVVRKRMKGCAADEFDYTFLANIEAGLRGLSEA